tara:strand:- start:651 stop:770 length:120 start_codon:yes stop_codon:yes gene_type:complete
MNAKNTNLDFDQGDIFKYNLEVNSNELILFCKYDRYIFF